MFQMCIRWFSTMQDLKGCFIANRRLRCFIDKVCSCQQCLSPKFPRQIGLKHECPGNL